MVGMRDVKRTRCSRRSVERWALRGNLVSGRLDPEWEEWSFCFFGRAVRGKREDSAGKVASAQSSLSPCNKCCSGERLLLLKRRGEGELWNAFLSLSALSFTKKARRNVFVFLSPLWPFFLLSFAFFLPSFLGFSFLFPLLCWCVLFPSLLFSHNCYPTIVSHVCVSHNHVNRVSASPSLSHCPLFASFCSARFGKKETSFSQETRKRVDASHSCRTYEREREKVKKCVSTYGIRVLFFEPIHSLRNPGRKGIEEAWEKRKDEKSNMCALFPKFWPPNLLWQVEVLDSFWFLILSEVFLSLWPSVSLLLSISSFIQRMPPAWNSRKMRGVENSWDYPWIPHPFLPSQQVISHRLFHQNSLFPITGERNDHLSAGQAATPKAERSCLALLCLFFILSLQSSHSRN